MKLTTSSQVAASIPDGATVFVSGNGEMLVPDDLLAAIEQRFLESGSPRDITLVYNVFPGGKYPGTGIERLAHPGLVKRVFAGSYYSLRATGLSELTSTNQVEAYLMPYGTIYGMLRAAASNQPGVLTRVGVGTFVDPRHGGGKITDITTEDIIRVMEVDGEEFLYVPAVSIDIALLRGTTADEDGNVSLELEPNTMGILLEAMATNASKGRVVVQTMQMAARGTIRARDVVLPGIFVDEVVVAPNQMEGLPYRPAWTGAVRVPEVERAPTVIDHRLVVARRAAAELRPGELVNVGMGLAASVPGVARDEGIADQVIFNTEHGPLGGIPNDRENFGPAENMSAYLDSPSMFDMYASGRLDASCLGLGEVDESGSVNVSLINGRYNLGGFLDIVFGAKQIVFCGTFTAGGLQTDFRAGQLHILTEGAHRKFVSSIKQTSFDAVAALGRGQRALYITERAVFRLTPTGLELIEIAPGVDLQTQVLDLMDFTPAVSPDLALMSPALFTPGLMGLSFQHGFANKTKGYIQ